MTEFITIDDIDPDETATGLNQYHIDEANRAVNRLIVTLGKDPEIIKADEDKEPHVSGLAMARALYLAYASSLVGDDSDNEAKTKAKKEHLEKLEGEVAAFLSDRPATIEIKRG